MARSSSLIGPAALVALVACGNHGASVDAIPPCDYTETADSSNAATATAEATALTLGVTTHTICGQVDKGHFDSASNTVDVDSFDVAVGPDVAELILQFEDSTPASLTGFQVAVFDTSTNPVLLNAGNFDPTLGDHGAFLSELPPGNYAIVVTATASADLAAPIPYKVRLVADMPTMRCPDSTAKPSPDYTEANDTASNTGNDVMLVDFTKPASFSLTASTTDAPEPTGLTVDPRKNFHITGSSGAVAAGADNYLDRDTYEVTTGKAMNELSIRLDWGGSTADLDYVVFQEGQLTATATATLTSLTQDEFNTFAVLPMTKYWVWVGAHDGSTGLPLAYDLTVCGGEFNP